MKRTKYTPHSTKESKFIRMLIMKYTQASTKKEQEFYAKKLADIDFF